MSRQLQLKICGLKFPENLQQVADLRPDYVGMIFFEGSPRFVLPELTPETMPETPGTVKKVGVFVNASTEEILKSAQNYQLDGIQLHGQETPETGKKIREAGFQVLKAFPMRPGFSWKSLEPWISVADFFLFDTPTARHGGSGRTFDWSVLQEYPYSVPFFLSGGLSLETLPALAEFQHPQLAGLDVNSRFETAPGLKSISQLKQLIKFLEDEISG